MSSATTSGTNLVMSSVTDPNSPLDQTCLRRRLSLYPTQFLVAWPIVSVGPLLNSMMGDLGVPLSRGGLISAGLYLGNVTGIIILNTTMAQVPAQRVLLAATTLQGAGLIAAGAASWRPVVARASLRADRLQRSLDEHHLLDVALRSHEERTRRPTPCR